MKVFLFVFNLLFLILWSWRSITKGSQQDLREHSPDVSTLGRKQRFVSFCVCLIFIIGFWVMGWIRIGITIFRFSWFSEFLKSQIFWIFAQFSEKFLVFSNFVCNIFQIFTEVFIIFLNFFSGFFQKNFMIFFAILLNFWIFKILIFSKFLKSQSFWIFSNFSENISVFSKILK